MNTLHQLLQLPLGTQLAVNNWESHVYELGEEWVYKEIRTEHELDTATKHYDSRYTLQRFWCSDTHFHNMQHDSSVLRTALKDWWPQSFITRQPSRFNDNPHAIVTIQQRLRGRLLKDMPEYTSENLERLRNTVHTVVNVLRAPLDFHPGNIIVIPETDTVYFFDTGTPSDWKFLLDPTRLQTAIDIPTDEAVAFVDFMRPIHARHIANCTAAS